MSIDVMKQALEALEALWQIIDEIDTASDMAKDNDVWYRERVQHLQQKRWQLGITTDGNKLEGGAMDALRAAIEQAQEPVAWRWKERVNGDFDNWVVTFSEPPPYAIEQQPLYTTPQPAQQPLTEKRINELYSVWIVDCQDIVGFTRAIERAAHGTKENT